MTLSAMMSTLAPPVILAVGLVLTPVAAQPRAAVAPAPGSRLTPLPPSPDPGRPLPLRIGGRVVGPAGADPLARYRRQWPGTYIEAAFRGSAATLAIGPGEVSLRVRVDGGAPVALVRPVPGLYRIPAAGAGAHRVRVEIVSESQAGATAFGGIYAPPGTQPLPVPPPPARRIEFIGDSHTVGYGNTAGTTTCSEAQVWAATDTSQGPAAVTAARYGADYRVNAISGRGIVRNYGGMAATTLPDAYPFALFDGATRAQDDGWRPQVIAISLGTNDFSTALTPGERWPTRAALHADYEQRYVAFVQALRRRDPGALVILWATDMADGEIAREVGRVAAKLRAMGDRRVATVTVPGLRFAGCHAHPDLADARTIAAAIGGAIDARADAWGGR